MIFNSEQTISVKFGMLQVNKVMLNEIEVWSNGTPIAYSGEAVLSGIMTANGYSNLTTDAVENTYVTLTVAEQAALNVIGENATVSNDNLGVATVTLAGSNSLSVADFRLLEESIDAIIGDGELEGTPETNIYNDIWGRVSDEYNDNGFIFTEQINQQIATYQNTYEYIFVWGNDVYASNSIFYIVSGSILKCDGNYVKTYFQTDIKVRDTYDPVYGWIIGFMASITESSGTGLEIGLHVYQNCYYNNPKIDVVGGSLGEGTLHMRPELFGTTVNYIYNNYYNTPLPVTPEGAITIAIPYTTDPTNDASIPEEEVTLQTVIAGLNILYSFFSDGGSIIMSDNSVIIGATTGIHDLVRSTLGYKSVISK